MLFPNPHTVPSNNNAIVLFTGLADTSATSSNIGFCVNVALFDVVPSPRFPYPLYPLEYTCPLESNAIIVLFSTATSTMFSNSITSVGTFEASIFVIFSSACTFTGNVLVFVSPSPKFPYPLYPHAYTFPSLSNARE